MLHELNVTMLKGPLAACRQSIANDILNALRPSMKPSADHPIALSSVFRHAAVNGFRFSPLLVGGAIRFDLCSLPGPLLCWMKTAFPTPRASRLNSAPLLSASLFIFPRVSPPTLQHVASSTDGGAAANCDIFIGRMHASTSHMQQGLRKDGPSLVQELRAAGYDLLIYETAAPSEG